MAVGTRADEDEQPAGTRGTMHHPPRFEHHPDGTPAAGAPWPGANAGHATHAGAGPVASAHAPQQRFEYSRGFVLPGAAQGQPQLSAHQGTIGLPPAPAGQLHHDAPRAGGGGAMHQPAPAQAWAFPTTSGLQLVDAGSMPRHDAPGVARLAPHAGVAPSTFTAATRRRLRWESMVAVVVVACLAAAGLLFATNFDRIMGRPNSTATSTKLRGSAGLAAGTEDRAEATEQARASVDAGRLEAAMVARVERQRRARDWAGVLRTLDQLQALRPLSPAQQRLQRTARAVRGSDRALARARSLMARGLDAQALAVVERALAARADRRLEALREQLSARRAAPARPSTRGSSGPPVAGGGDHGAHGSSGPGGGVKTTARPPSSVPAGSLPERPKIPNPVTTPTSGAAAVGGGGGTCHVHDGVRECH